MERTVRELCRRIHRTMLDLPTLLWLSGGVVHEYVPALPSDETNYPMALKNVFDKTAYDGHGWYISGGRIADDPSKNATVVMRAIPEKTYYYKHCSVTGGGRVLYTTIEDWSVGSLASTIVSSVTIGANHVESFTVPRNAKWIFILAGRADSSATAPFEEQIGDFILSEAPIGANVPYVAYGTVDKFVKDTTDNTFGYFNEVTDKFNEVSGATGTVIQRVQYLTFDGSSYLDLAPLTTESDIEMRFRKDVLDTNFLFGTNPNSSTSTVIGAWVGSGGLNIQNGSVRYRVNIDTDWHSFEVTSEKIYVDSEEKADAGIRSTFQDLIVGGARDERTGVIDSRGFSGDISDFTVGTYKFIAVMIGTVGYFLNTVEWKLYANAGTGSFTAGADIPWEW